MHDHPSSVVVVVIFSILIFQANCKPDGFWWLFLCDNGKVVGVEDTVVSKKHMDEG